MRFELRVGLDKQLLVAVENSWAGQRKCCLDFMLILNVSLI